MANKKSIIRKLCRHSGLDVAIEYSRTEVTGADNSLIHVYDDYLCDRYIQCKNRDCKAYSPPGTRDYW